MKHNDNDKDHDGSLDGVKITVEGDDGDDVNMSWSEFAGLLGVFWVSRCGCG